MQSLLVVETLVSRWLNVACFAIDCRRKALNRVLFYRFAMGLLKKAFL